MPTTSVKPLSSVLELVKAALAIYSIMEKNADLSGAGSRAEQIKTLSGFAKLSDTQQTYIDLHEFLNSRAIISYLPGSKRGFVFLLLNLANQYLNTNPNLSDQDFAKQLEQLSKHHGIIAAGAHEAASAGLLSQATAWVTSTVRDGVMGTDNLAFADNCRSLLIALINLVNDKKPSSLLLTQNLKDSLLAEGEVTAEAGTFSADAAQPVSGHGWTSIGVLSSSVEALRAALTYVAPKSGGTAAAADSQEGPDPLAESVMIGSGEAGQFTEELVGLMQEEQSLAQQLGAAETTLLSMVDEGDVANAGSGTAAQTQDQHDLVVDLRRQLDALQRQKEELNRRVTSQGDREREVLEIRDRLAASEAALAKKNAQMLAELKVVEERSREALLRVEQQKNAAERKLQETQTAMLEAQVAKAEAERLKQEVSKAQEALAQLQGSMDSEQKGGALKIASLELRLLEAEHEKAALSEQLTADRLQREEEFKVFSGLIKILPQEIKVIEAVGGMRPLCDFLVSVEKQNTQLVQWIQELLYMGQLIGFTNESRNYELGRQQALAPLCALYAGVLDTYSVHCHHLMRPLLDPTFDPGNEDYQTALQYMSNCHEGLLQECTNFLQMVAVRNKTDVTFRTMCRKKHFGSEGLNENAMLNLYKSVLDELLKNFFQFMVKQLSMIKSIPELRGEKTWARFVTEFRPFACRNIEYIAAQAALQPPPSIIQMFNQQMGFECVQPPALAELKPKRQPSGASPSATVQPRFFNEGDTASSAANRSPESAQFAQFG